MDTLEVVGRAQYIGNLKLMENYRMLNGEFLSYQYEDTEENEYVSLLEMAKQQEQKNLRLRHFDFIKQAVNTLCGELEAHPDTFIAKGIGDSIAADREREKARLLKEWVDEQINQRINAQLMQMGMDPQRDDFQSEEEQQQYTQQVEEQRKALTPAEIQKYINTQWQHVAEKWANIQLQVDKHEHNRPRLQQREFRDMLVSDRAFRHFYLTATGYGEETWNPIETFYHKSPEVEEVEKGNYVGRIFFRSLSDIIDHYGHLMTGKQLEQLRGPIVSGSKEGGTYPKDWMGNPINYLDINGNPYQSRIPTNNKWLTTLFPQVSQLGGLNTDFLFHAPETIEDDYRYYIKQMFGVTQAYWKSQKKVGKLSYLNPETGLVEKVIIDESVVLPLGTRSKEGNLTRDTDPEEEDLREGPIVQWTWINEIWGGIKITPLAHTTPARKPIYLNVKPLSFQGKPDIKIYDAELPVVGEIFNDRNARSQSMVDLLKPYQIAYNLFMNQAYLIIEEEILPFVMMDVNAIPNLKDWGGPEGFEKWIQSTRSKFGMLDNRPQQTQGANAGGQLPAVIDLGSYNHALARFDLAERIKLMAFAQIGMNPQRLASVKPQETATGVQTAMQQSFTQTSSYFTRFYNYIRRCLQKGLDFAQYVQSGEDDILTAAVHSDYSNTLLRLNGIELLSAQLKVFVTDAQEEQRQLAVVRQLAIENNTVLTSMSDRIEMSTSNSVAKIKELVKASELEQQAQQAQMQQLEQQKLQQMSEEADKQRAFDAEQNELDRKARLEEAYIKTFGYGEGATVDSDNSGSPDALEYDKLSQKASSEASKQQLAERKLQQDNLKLLADQKKHNDKLNLDREKMRSNERIAKDKLASSRALGDKSK